MPRRSHAVLAVAAVVALTVALVVTSAPIAPFYSAYAGGAIEAHASPTVPDDASPVAVGDSGDDDSILLLTALHRADRNGSATVAMPTAADARTVDRSLPDEARYSGTGERGYFLTWRNSTYRVETWVLI